MLLFQAQQDCLCLDLKPLLASGKWEYNGDRTVHFDLEFKRIHGGNSAVLQTFYQTTR